MEDIALRRRAKLAVIVKESLVIFPLRSPRHFEKLVYRTGHCSTPGSAPFQTERDKAPECSFGSAEDPS